MTISLSRTQLPSLEVRFGNMYATIMQNMIKARKEKNFE